MVASLESDLHKSSMPTMLAAPEPPSTMHVDTEPPLRKVADTTTIRTHTTSTLSPIPATEAQAAAVECIPHAENDGHLDNQQGLPAPRESKFVLAIDFGTTYSTVSFAKIDTGTDAATLGAEDVECIANYEKAAGGSDARGNSRVENVPTELLYLGSATSALEVSDSDSDSASDGSDLRDVTSMDLVTYGQRRPVSRKRGRRSTKASRNFTRSTWTRAAGVSLKWGFGVQAMQRFPESLQRYSKTETVKLIKLSLGDDAEHLRGKRKELAQQVQRLVSYHFVRDRDQILRDYLTRLLHHARSMLRNEAGLRDDSEIEFVLCVPVSWSESACRTMHDAMAKAIQNCRLESLTHNVISNLFIVSEPEAAAQFALSLLGYRGRLRRGEVFVLLDAGGGTVDITTYKVTSDGTGPLRLEAEMVPPGGALCGSSLISERYGIELRAKMRKQNLTQPADLEARVTQLTNEWDLIDKPRIDIAKGKFQRRQVFVYGHKIVWTREEISALFEPSLKGVTDLLEKQLDLAETASLTVGKLIVVGGFGESRSLRSRIEQVLEKVRNRIGATIDPIWPESLPTSAVARGAVLRALNKEDGPRRVCRSSFGFLRQEEYDAFPEHKEAGVKPKKDSVDRCPQVNDTIYWVLEAVSKVQTTLEFACVLTCFLRARSCQQGSKRSPSCLAIILNVATPHLFAQSISTHRQGLTARISRNSIRRTKVRPQLRNIHCNSPI